MVYSVEYKVSIDKQGRMVIPAPIREALGLVGGGEAVVRLSGNRIIVEVIDSELESRVEEWARRTLSVDVDAFVEELEGSWKWMSREYAERKLGLR